MSQDMMQALSGSSLLSLSVGTLPAVKSGMMLDANPFASQLALMTGPDALLGSPVSGDIGAPVVADAGFALALADAADGAAVAAQVAPSLTVPVAPAASTAPDILALPDDASPSQIIEAVLNASKDAGVPAAAAAPAHAHAAAAGLNALPQSEAEQAGPALHKVTPQAMPEAAMIEDTATDQPVARPRRAAKADDAIALPTDTAPVALPIITPAAPTPVRPEGFAPENGTVRIAVSAAPSTPTQSLVAADPAKPGTAVPDMQPAPPQRETAPAAPIAQAQAAPLPGPEPREAAASRSIEAPLPVQAPATFAATETVSAAAATPASVDGNAMQRVTEPAPQTAAAAAQAPVPATPASQNLQATPAAGTADIAPVPAQASVTEPATGAVLAQQVQAQMLGQPQRAAPAAQRSAISAEGRQAIQAASKSARPAQALAALFDLADPAAQPAPALSRRDATASASIDAVPPAWAAALNAVVSPMTSASLQGMTAPGTSAAGSPSALETLAFDAAFVANVETQIARVAGGGEMVRMQIMPEHLGRIDIEMLAGPDRDQVRIVTEHDAVRDTLVQSQVRLEQDLRNSGQRNTDVTVELRQQSPGTQGGSAQQQRGQSGTDAGQTRDGLQRPSQVAETASDSKPAQRRPRGNVRYA